MLLQDSLDERTLRCAQELIAKYPENITRNTIEDMISAFQVIDKDGSKSIESCEVEHMLQVIGFNPEPSKVQSMIAKVDVSGGTSELCSLKAATVHT